MKITRESFCKLSISTVGIAPLLDLILTTTAFGATLGPIDVKVNSEVIGNIQINTPNNEQLQGKFSVTKKDDKGNTLSIDQLEKMLGQNHLNWFQTVIKINPPSDGVKVGLIDPPLGGFDAQWADNIPWYFDEVEPPAPLPDGKKWDSKFLLSNNVMGSELKFFDVPSGFPSGTNISFSTFLISDFGNKTYQVLGEGFSWSATFTDAGNTEIKNLKTGETFTDDFAKNIKNDFGYTQVPEPLTILGSGAALGIGALMKKRHSKSLGDK